MSKKRVIKLSNLPTRVPLIPTIAILALLKAYDASRVIYAVVLTLLVISWIATLITAVWAEKQTDIFKDKEGSDR